MIQIIGLRYFVPKDSKDGKQVRYNKLFTTVPTVRRVFSDIDSIIESSILESSKIIAAYSMTLQNSTLQKLENLSLEMDYSLLLKLFPPSLIEEISNTLDYSIKPSKINMMPH